METQEEKETTIWEWDDSASDAVEPKWTSFDNETIPMLEEAYLQGIESLDLSHGFFGNQGGYLINFHEMTQTKNASGFARQIQRRQDGGENQAKKVNTAFWEWDSSGKWIRYDPETNGILNQNYEKKLERFALAHGYFGTTSGYTIDFVQMKQIRDSSSYGRRIRRTPIANRLGRESKPTKTFKVPSSDRPRPSQTPLKTETVHCDPAVARSLRNAVALFSRREGDNPSEAPAEDILVD